MAESSPTNFFSNSLYNRLKFIAQILLPALGTLWFAVGSAWNLPHTTEIVGTITAIDAFLGFILQISTKAYYDNGENFDGDVSLVSAEGGEKVQFSIEKDPQEIIQDEPGKHSLEFRINRQTGRTENS